MTPMTISEVMLKPAAADRDRDAAAAREHAAATLAAAILDVLAFPVAFAVSHGVDPRCCGA